MSSFEPSEKRLFSRNFIITILALLVLAGFSLVLIFTVKWRIEMTNKEASPETDIKQEVSVSYDKNKILVDTTSEPLEIIELPSLETNK